MKRSAARRLDWLASLGTLLAVLACCGTLAAAVWDWRAKRTAATPGSDRA